MNPNKYPFLSRFFAERATEDPDGVVDTVDTFLFPKISVSVSSELVLVARQR